MTKVGVTVSPTDMGIALYHWSPTSRSKSIVRLGLVPGRTHVTHTPGWRAPWVCFAETPSWAWALSGYFHPEIPAWDLWQTYVSCLVEPEFLESYDEHRWHEVRTRHRVYKRDLWLVGSR